jgi:mRNA interferase HigB
MVRVIKRMPLQRFWDAWPAAVAPLKNWYRDTRRARWRSFPDVKATFGATDQVKVASGNAVAVFDIGGNKFRLIARISYEKQKVYVLRVLTHKEYDRGLWKTQL